MMCTDRELNILICTCLKFISTLCIIIITWPGLAWPGLNSISEVTQKKTSYYYRVNGNASIY